MTWSFVQSASFAAGGSATGTLAATFSGAQTAGDLIVVGVNLNPGHTVSSIGDTSGNSWHLAKHVTDVGSDACDIYLYYAYGIFSAGAGANTVIVSATSGFFQDLFIAEWSVGSAITSDPLNATGGNSSTANTTGPNCSITTTLPNCLIVGCSASDNGQNATGSGWTKRIQTSDDEIMLDAVEATAGTYTPSTTPTDDDWTIAVAAFAAPGTVSVSDVIPMIGGGRNPRNSTYLRMKQSKRAGLYLPDQVIL